MLARKKGPHVDQAFQLIRDKILSFQLPPRSPVSDYNLAAEIGMSRAPVREAILRLEAEGLIQNVNGKILVASIDIQDIVEICQVREAVETSAVKIAMESGALAVSQKDELRTIYESLAKAMGQESFLENYHQDDLFHAALVSYAGNSRLTQISERMRLQMQRARWLNVLLPNRQTDAAEEHCAIFHALMADDLENSVKSISAHLFNSINNFQMVFSNPNLQMNIMCIQNVISSSETHREIDDKAD